MASINPHTAIDSSPVLGYRPPMSPPQPQRSPSSTPLNSHAHVFPPIPSPTGFEKDPESGSHKDSMPVHRRGRELGGLKGISAEGLDKSFWIVGPIVGYGASIALLIVALWREDNAYGVVQQVGGTGRVDFGILASCAIAPGTTNRICGARSLHANFVPSLELISPAVPGYALLQLPFFSVQTPTIFFSGLILAIASLLVYLPIWAVYNFPRTNLLPRPVLKAVRQYPFWFYQAAALLSGASFVVVLTIGIGYELYMQAFSVAFTNWQNLALYTGLTDAETSRWTFVVGESFSLVWAAVSFLGATTFSTAAALHNGFDEAVEYQDLGSAYRR